MRCKCCNHPETVRWKGDYYCHACKDAISETLVLPKSFMDEAYLVEDDFDEDMQFWNSLLKEDDYE